MTTEVGSIEAEVHMKGDVTMWSQFTSKPGHVSQSLSMCGFRWSAAYVGADDAWGRNAPHKSGEEVTSLERGTLSSLT